MRRGGGARKIVWMVGLLVGCVLLVGVLAQFLGPKIATRVVRDKLARYGSVHSVSVHALPAVKLLWREADEVTVSAGQLQVSPDQAVALLKEADGVDRVHAHVEVLRAGPLRLTDATLLKHGKALRAEGVMSMADITRALPAGVQVAILGSEGDATRVRVSGGLFGVRASLEAVARAEDGKLVVAPTTFPLNGLRMTLLDNPHVYVEGVSAQALDSGSGGGARYELSMWASLR